LRSLYFDSAYLAKCYLADPDSHRVRKLVQSAEAIYSSALCIAEVSCALHQAVREKSIARQQASSLQQTLLEDVSIGIVQLVPISEVILRSVEAVVAKLPSTVFLRAGDAIHLATAQHSGFQDVWTNDRHMLKAATHFGITGCCV
jgi:predicted nucleic acid-binding protein